MALINPPGFAQVRLVWTLSGDLEPFNTLFGVSNDSDVSAAAVAQNVADAFVIAFSGSEMATGSSLQRVDAQLGQDGGEGPVGTSIQNYIGTSGGACLPQNCAGLIHKRTALAGRKGRGRMYLPSFFLPEASIDSIGALNSALVTNLTNSINSFLSGLTTEGVPMVLFHESSPPSPTLVTSLQVDPIIATQRRRLRK
jgi:hypothetical protein